MLCWHTPYSPARSWAILLGVDLSSTHGHSHPVLTYALLACAQVVHAAGRGPGLHAAHPHQRRQPAAGPEQRDVCAGGQCHPHGARTGAASLN
eukprot:1158487-Pelagomonas_calceolata.AAC.10